jgi:hypothetical protein
LIAFLSLFGGIIFLFKKKFVTLPKFIAEYDYQYYIYIFGESQTVGRA